MTNQPSSQQITAADGVSPRLRALGTRSWLYLGIALWTLAIITFLGAISGLVVPLAIAIITNYMASDKLDMHPIVTLVTTLGGGILFGALGATLANPVTAILIDAQKQIQAYQSEQQTGDDQN